MIASARAGCCSLTCLIAAGLPKMLSRVVSISCAALGAAPGARRCCVRRCMPMLLLPPAVPDADAGCWLGSLTSIASMSPSLIPASSIVRVSGPWMGTLLR